MQHHVRTLTSTLALIACAGAASAMDTTIVGPRAMGMGGVGVACADDYVAQYYNPALFGFFGMGREAEERTVNDNQELKRKVWGFGLDAAAGARISGDVVSYADNLADVDFDRLNNLGAGTDAQAVQDLVTVTEALSHLKAKADTVTVDFNGGMGVRVLHGCFGVRGFGQVTGQVDVIDLQNLGLDGSVNTAELSTDIIAAGGGSGAVSGYTPTFFTASQISQIASALGGTADANTAALIIDQQAVASGVDRAQAQTLIDTLVGSGGSTGIITALATGGSIDGNQTLVTVTGLTVAEAAFSYGYAIDDHLSVGATAKLLVGRVYGLPWLPFQDDREFSDIVSDAQKNYKQSIAGAIDLGVAARFEWVQFGLTGRNLNAPTFKGPTVRAIDGRMVTFKDQTIDPSVTAGAAFVPHPTLTVAVDGDLLPTGTTREGYDQQRVGAGLEWNAFWTLALRGGVSKNVAQGDTGLLYHGGVGLNLWAMRVDLGAMMSSETVTYDGDEYPREARVALALATDW